MQTKWFLILQATYASRIVVTPAIYRIGKLLNNAGVAIAFNPNPANVENMVSSYQC